MVVQVQGNSECGRAPLGSVKETALLVIQRSCFGQFSLAHELGHLLSANHNPENIETPSLFPYGHGYRYKSNQWLVKGWSTIMSVGSTKSIPRINYWSNPLQQRAGVPMGAGETHDNARVLNETKSIVASFYPDPEPVPLQGQSSIGIFRLYTPQGVRKIGQQTLSN